MDYRYDISTFNTDGSVNVVVEVPKGTHNKYEIDPAKGDKLTIVRTLNKGFLGYRDYKYIFNYGFIPNTEAPDHDQLDAIIIADEAINPLTVLKCKVVGVIRTIDDGEQDDKILVVPVYSTQKSFDLNKILKFLRHYKYPRQSSTIVGDVLGAADATKTINECRLYMKKPETNESK